MAIDNKDQSVLNHIDRLVKEEELLYRQTELTGDDRVRLAKLKVELDQCWDLLRQRRALREFGDNPDKASVRPAKIVENYKQYGARTSKCLRQSQFSPEKSESAVPVISRAPRLNVRYWKPHWIKTRTRLWNCTKYMR